MGVSAIFLRTRCELGRGKFFKLLEKRKACPIRYITIHGINMLLRIGIVFQSGAAEYS